ncbi:hypothetical protein K438DRAFT_1823274 [Mycena galopus ATCC 62051]|nr:hypothetical protein K438DRAFT_1823274 [Mycena galopus ATCC 62051]
MKLPSRSVVSRISSLRILRASIMLASSLTRLSSTTISAAHVEGDMEGKISLHMWQSPSARQKGKSWCLFLQRPLICSLEVTLALRISLCPLIDAPDTYLVRTGMHTTNAPRCSTHVANPQLPSC